MIVSASYRTDIPAFFGPWFADCWRQGFALTENPYNGKPVRVDLSPDAVSGIVFWTRDAARFFDGFARVADAGVPFVVQYTATGYGPPLEPRAPPWRAAVAVMADIARRFGPRRVVWRYDPILFAEGLSARDHRVRFAAIADALAGIADEAVVSFVQIYRKTRRGLDAAGLPWRDPPDADKRALLAELAAIAAEKGMRLSLCAQRSLLAEGFADAACIDPARLSAVAGHPVTAAARPHRPDCGCAASRDIGRFATCRFGCAYCYAA